LQVYENSFVTKLYIIDVQFGIKIICDENWSKALYGEKNTDAQNNILAVSLFFMLNVFNAVYNHEAQA
jgi:hypothetical protein